MKKKIALVACVALMATALIGCGKDKGTCEGCGQEAELYTIEQSVDGESSVNKVCVNCKDATVAALDAAAEAGYEVSYSVK